VFEDIKNALTNAVRRGAHVATFGRGQASSFEFSAYNSHDK
jgi:hypothetical protein